MGGSFLGMKAHIGHWSKKIPGLLMSSITQHKVTLCWVVWRRMRLKFKEWQIWKQTPLCLMCGHIHWLHMKGIGHRCETCLAFMAVALNIQVTTQNGIMQSGQNMRSASSETVCVCLLVVKWNAKWTQLMTSGELHNPVWQSWRKFAKKTPKPSDINCLSACVQKLWSHQGCFETFFS